MSDDLDQRLTILETKFNERWTLHEKRNDEICDDLRSSIKDLIMKLQLFQEKMQTCRDACNQNLVKEVSDLEDDIEKKMAAYEKRSEKAIDDFERKMWKLGGALVIAFPTLFYAIYQLASLLLQALKGTNP